MFKKIISVCLVMMLTACAVPGLSESSGEDFATQFAKDLMAGEKSTELYALFSDTVKAQLPETVFGSIWGQVTAQFGAFQSFGETTVQEANGMTAYLLPLNMEKDTLIMQLVVNGEGKVEGFNFTKPQATAKPASEEQVKLPEGIVEEEITVGEGEWALPGTLTLPASGNSFPAVVLVQGSGAHDRDESVGGTKVFRDIAWHLAQNGIAVLRYDKRTYAHSTKFTQDLVSSLSVEEEVIQDAILAGNLIKSDSRINGEKIFLLGHSLGAMMGPRIASQSDGLFAGMLLVAGTPLKLTDIIVAQNEAALSKLSLDMQAAQRPALDAEMEKLEKLSAMKPEEAKATTLFGQPAYYFYEMNQVDTAQKVLDLQIPTLIIQGGKDFQVTVENGLNAWKTALGEPDYVTYKLYPELNHLMMVYTGDASYQGSVAEYDTPANLSEEAAKDMVEWILAH